MSLSTKQTLVEAFRRLTKRERANLLYHHDRGTKICCGPTAYNIALDGAG